MKIIHKDAKHGELKVRTESKQDLWYLSNMIEPGDSISGMTERKIKIGGGSDEKSKISRRNVFLKISAEKVELDSTLRISGKIIEAPDDIPKGDYHTFDIDDGTVFTIHKAEWSNYIVKKLEEASKSSGTNVLVVIFDREEAIFAVLRDGGHEIILWLKGDVAKKDQEQKGANFYKEISSNIKSLDSKSSYSNIVIASPAFWKEYLLKEIEGEDINRKIVLATCSDVNERSMDELLKRPELKTVMEKEKAARELAIIDELLKQIRKDNAAYGLDAVSEKIRSGNISSMLISENLVLKHRRNKDMAVERLMSDSEKSGADVILLSSDEAMKKLDGISGIAAFLRWRENYGTEVQE